ncbi:hypothetical protein MTR67_007104 [Solanum verrucosum]|uniref:Uncharacterized protein n=1 Tax=Solanum verrucosum TaxID=315347 RepID=A0AAF0TCS8_SOLVR|nr:hypothetical protein MTR67_007104 [Solanum verrucosum]
MWEMINMDLFSGFPHSRRKLDSIWVILYRMTNQPISYRGVEFIAQFWKSFQRGLGSKVNLCTIFHPETDGQVERAIHTLEDMLRACVIDFKGPDLAHQVMEKVKIIQEMLKTAQNHQKSYTDVIRRDLEFEVDDWVYLKVLPMMGAMRISKRIGNVAYESELPPELAAIRLVFHISMLKKCMGDPSLIIPTEDNGIKDNLSYEEIPVKILDRHVRKLRTKEVTSVKVLWRNQFVEEASWEAEEDIKKIYPHLFPSREIQDPRPKFKRRKVEFQEVLKDFGEIAKNLVHSSKTEDEASNAVITCTIVVYDRIDTVLLDRGSTCSYVPVQFTLGLICNAKYVTLAILGREKLEWEKVYKRKPTKVISSIQARKLVGQRCLAFLAHLRDVEAEFPSIEFIPIVSKFKEVFPIDLPGMAPDRDIDFCIDLEPGTRPISIPHYHMSPMELRQLKAQIH